MKTHDNQQLIEQRLSPSGQHVHRYIYVLTVTIIAAYEKLVDEECGKTTQST